MRSYAGSFLRRPSAAQQPALLLELLLADLAAREALLENLEGVPPAAAVACGAPRNPARD